MSHFAHTLEHEPPEKWEPLREHLGAVAERASQFAAEFDASDWAKVAGLWHDVGKYSDEFQAYLKHLSLIHISEPTRPY